MPPMLQDRVDGRMASIPSEEVKGVAGNRRHGRRASEPSGDGKGVITPFPGRNER